MFFKIYNKLILNTLNVRYSKMQNLKRQNLQDTIKY
jgi:hypothetical protein